MPALDRIPLRIRLELLAAASAATLGLMAGISHTNPSGFSKHLLSLLAGASSATIAFSAYHCLTSKEGSLKLEKSRLEQQIKALAHQLEEARTERDTFLAAEEATRTELKALQEDLAQQAWDLKSAQSDAQQWQVSAQKVRAAAEALKEQLQRTIAAHRQELAAHQKQHGKSIHREVKAKSIEVGKRLHEIHARKSEEERAELQSQHSIQLQRYEDRIAELEAQLATLKAQLAETDSDKSALATTLESLHKEDLPDIRRTFEAEWNENDRQLQAAIEQLQQQYQQAIQPDRFAGIRESARRGNAIIDYFLKQGILLDARWIDRGAKEDGIFYHFRDLQKAPDFLEQMNTPENLCWIQREMGLLEEPKFSFDAERILVKAVLIHSRIKTEAKEIERLIKPASQFLQIVRNWRRVRVTGGSEAGKSPTAENIACGIAIGNASYQLILHNPAEISRKNFWSIPVVSTTHKESLEALKAVAKVVKGEQSDLREIHIFDELDNTMSEFSESSKYIKEIAKQASHKNLGFVAIGQNANASNYKGFDRSDFNNLISVHIGANAFDAIENTNQFSSSEQQKLKAQAEKIRDYYDSLNKDFDSETEPEKLHRWAIVLVPGKPPFFLELPMFGKYQFSDIPRVNTDAAIGCEVVPADNSETSKPAQSKAVKNAVIAPIGCPQCGCEELAKNGYSDRAKSNKRYVCKGCGHRFKDSDLLVAVQRSQFK